MTPARAAVVYVLTQRIIDGVSKPNKDAGDALKAYFRSSGKTSYRGIGYAARPWTYLSVPLARAALGDAGVEECTLAGTREYLTLPQSATPIVPPELTD